MDEYRVAVTEHAFAAMERLKGRSTSSTSQMQFMQEAISPNGWNRCLWNNTWYLLNTWNDADMRNLKDRDRGVKSGSVVFLHEGKKDENDLWLHEARF